MKQRFRVIIVLMLLAVFLSLYILPGYSGAAEVGEILDSSGEAVLVRGDKEITPKHGEPVYLGDRINTLEGTILLAVGPHRILLTQRTALTLNEYSLGEKVLHSRFFLAAGKIWVWVSRITERILNFEIETRYALAGVRGTVFTVEYRPAEELTWVYVAEGEVEVSDLEHRKVKLSAGYETTVIPGRPPEPPLKGKKDKDHEAPQIKEKGAQSPGAGGAGEGQKGGKGGLELFQEKKEEGDNKPEANGEGRVEEQKGNLGKKKNQLHTLLHTLIGDTKKEFQHSEYPQARHLAQPSK